MNNHIHDQRRQYQHHIDIEELPFPASCIQIPDNAMNSYYTKVDAMQPPAMVSPYGPLAVDLSSTKHTEHLPQNDGSTRNNKLRSMVFPSRLH